MTESDLGKDATPGHAAGGASGATANCQENGYGGNIVPFAAEAKQNSLVGDPDAALKFLRAFAPDGPWLLVAIDPQTGEVSKPAKFAPEGEANARRWIQDRLGQQNLYFMVNAVPGTKRTKSDVNIVRALHVDVDPRAGEPLDAERDRALGLLRTYEPPPTVIVDSGGGFQGFWLLDEPVAVPEAERSGDGGWLALEDRNREIEWRLQADACHNIDRIMRLPGTINVPGEKKRKKGRVPALAKVVEADWSRRYRLDQFPPAPPVTEGAKVEVSAIPAQGVDIDALPVSPGLRALIVQGSDPDDPGRWADRSKAVWHVACELIRAGVGDAVILGILLDPDLGISAHVLDQPRSESYARRQIERARDQVAQVFETKDGKIVANSQHNIRLAIRKLGVRVRHDLFAGRDRVEGLEGFGPALDDPAANRLWLLIDERFGFRPSRDLFLTVLSDAALRDTFHPVRDYLDGLTWDGTPRLEGWLTTYAQATDTPYSRAVGTLVLIAAVRRVRMPGAKFDEMLVLESPQGKDKSSALKVLATRDDWFTDDLPLNVEAKRVIEALSGKWIAEAGELKGMRRGGPEHLKGFLSRTHDKARMSYDRLEREVPRQWIVVGTTNDARYLRDLTGNRRFWPVKVEAFDLEALRRDRDQLWAEAAHLEAQEASIRLDPSLWDAAAAEQDARRVEDPFYEALLDALGEVEKTDDGTVVGDGTIRGEHVWEILKRPAGQRSQQDNERMGDAMRRLGFERKKMRFGDKVVWGYQRGDGTAELWLPPDPPF